MTWLIWRQHRVQVAIAVLLLAAFAVPVAVTGKHLAEQLTACRSGASCGGLFQHYQGISTLVDVTIMVPLLIGVFWGATIVGRELEAGTVGLVWTQSVTRRTWLVTKLATLFGFAVLAAGAVAALVTWWSNTHNVLVQSRFTAPQFDIQGIVPVAYALFASALGLAAGVLWRRTLPAMATTVGVFVAVRLVVEIYVRMHFMAPVTTTASFAKVDAVPSGVYQISSDVTLHGHVVSGPLAVPTPCVSAATRPEMNECMSRLGYSIRTTYQPAGRFWTFQWIEFGIFAALAAALVAVGVTVLLRNDG